MPGSLHAARLTLAMSAVTSLVLVDNGKWGSTNGSVPCPQRLEFISICPLWGKKWGWANESIPWPLQSWDSGQSQGGQFFFKWTRFTHDIWQIMFSGGLWTEWGEWKQTLATNFQGTPDGMRAMRRSNNLGVLVASMSPEKRWNGNKLLRVA